MDARTICRRRPARSIRRFWESWCMAARVNAKLVRAADAPRYCGGRDRLRTKAGVFMLIAGMLAAGCASPKGSGEPGTVNFLIEASPTNLDPRIGADAYSQHIDGLIFSSLVSHDAQMRVTL